jgi:hypothetical protein
MVAGPEWGNDARAVGCPPGEQALYNPKYMPGRYE